MSAVDISSITEFQNNIQGVSTVNETEILAFIIQLLGSYIFVSVATNNAQKQTVLDSKQDLRTTKEDLMSELKDTREALLRENEVSTQAIIDIVKAEIKAEVEKGRRGL